MSDKHQKAVLTLAPWTTNTTQNTFDANGRAHIRHLCRKTTALSCHRCLIKNGVEKINNV